MPRKAAASARAEAKAIESDEVTQEQGGPVGPRRIATGYVHTTHPETGVKVVFVRGEALPAWVPVDDEPDEVLP